MNSANNGQFIAQTNAQTNAQPHSKQHIEMCDSTNNAQYSARELAQEFSIGESTLRTRWFEWICKVAPDNLLKIEKKYTHLARELFSEFSKLQRREREAWVIDAQKRYSHEWGNVGVIHGDLLPPEVGGALAKISQKNSSADIEIHGLRTELKDLISQVKGAESDFSQAEIDSFRKRGVRRGLQQFKIETQTQAQTVNALREQLLEDDS